MSGEVSVSSVDAGECSVFGKQARDAELAPSLYERVRDQIPSSVSSVPTRAYHGPPGTGKTYQLKGDVRDELDRGTDPTAICATSYRRKMAESLAAELGAELGFSRKNKSPWLNTTHGICLKLVSEQREELSVCDDERLAEFCADVGVAYSGEVAQLDPNSPFERSRPTPSPGDDGTYVGDIMLDTLQSLKSQGAPYHAWKDHASVPWDRLSEVFGRSMPTGEDFRVFDRAYSAFKRAWGLVDFTDMLLIAVDERLSPPCDVLIEDEFQDKTPLMIGVHNVWATRAKRVYVAGDPYQAIYGFMGTDARFMQEALERSEESVLLSHSYRNPPGVTAAARSILRLGGHTDAPTVEGRDDVSATVDRISRKEYESLVREHEDESTFHLFRVNYRKNQAARALEDAGVPFESKNGPEWTDKQVDFYNGVVKAKRAVGATEFGERPDFSAMSDSEKTRLVETLAGSMWTVTKGDFDGFGSFDGDVTDVVELRGLSKALAPANPMALLNGDGPLNKSVFGESINRRLKKTWDNRGPRIIESPSHRIMTIHAAKGLEADTVFLFNSTSPKAKSDPLGSRGDTDMDPEEARVWYVGVTRTRGDLYVVDGPSPREDLGVGR